MSCSECVYSDDKGRPVSEPCKFCIRNSKNLSGKFQPGVLYEVEIKTPLDFFISKEHGTILLSYLQKQMEKLVQEIERLKQEVSQIELKLQQLESKESFPTEQWEWWRTTPPTYHISDHSTGG